MIRSVGIVLFEGVRSLFSEPDCKKCPIYREWLEQELAEKKILMERILNLESSKSVNQDLDTLDEWPSINRNMTLSDIRRRLELAHKKPIVATESEKTEAEKLFEDNLNAQTKEASH